MSVYYQSRLAAYRAALVRALAPWRPAQEGRALFAWAYPDVLCDDGEDALARRYDDTEAVVTNLSVNGPWLNNQENHRRNSPWATYGKMSSVNAPGPSMLWVLLDEDIHGLNDAAFGFGMERQVWVDAPGSFHLNSCGFAFADGHSQIHKWAGKPASSAAANPTDWGWMVQRTSALVGAQP